jgi:hypothetical protein
MSAKTNSNKPPAANPLELLRDTGDTLKKDLIQPLPEEILKQIFGKTPSREKKFSGEIMPGQAVEMRDVYAGKSKDQENLSKMVHMEKRLREQDRVFVERRTQELRVQIQAIHEEIEKVVRITPQLTQEVEMAAFQAPGSPSLYELYFLERIFDFIKSFRKKIENASVWLATANKKAQKKNKWGSNYKKHGAKYLLSGEHYVSRSAG